VPNNLQRIEAIYLGQVQGVGFRYTTHRLASRWPVTGYVQNQPDGSVLLVAEGSEETLQAFLDEVQEVMASNIREVRHHRYAASNAFTGFEIRR
jgi:acylphosphatase